MGHGLAHLSEPQEHVASFSWRCLHRNQLADLYLFRYQPPAFPIEPWLLHQSAVFHISRNDFPPRTIASLAMGGCYYRGHRRAEPGLGRRSVSVDCSVTRRFIRSIWIGSKKSRY